MLGTGSIMKWFEHVPARLAHRRDVRARLVRVRHLGRGARPHRVRAARRRRARQHAQRLGARRRGPARRHPSGTRSCGHRPHLLGSADGHHCSRRRGRRCPRRPRRRAARARGAGAHPEHQRRPRARRRRRRVRDVGRRPHARRRARRRARAPRRRRSPVRRRRVDRTAPTRPPCCSTRTTTCNRPGYVDRWSSDPFEPREHDGRLFGRGTADDKAGAVAHVAAVRAWLDTAGALPCNVKVLVEGEEEIGSPDARRASSTRTPTRSRPTCCSSPTPATGRSARPASPTRCAASPASTCSVRALDGPVHSGMAGGAVPDPVLALAQMLATLVDEHGDPAFDGCWDDYDAPDAAERARLAALPRHVDGLRRAWGVRDGVELAGDPDVSIFERLWLRPTVTVIGIDGHPDRGIVEPDRRRGARRASACASGAARIRARLNDALAPPPRTPRAARARAHRHRARRGARVALRPDRLGVRRRRRARCAPASASTRCAWVSAARIPFVGPFADAFGGIPALLLGPADPGQPHPRRRREPPPRRLAQADRRARSACSPNSPSEQDPEDAAGNLAPMAVDPTSVTLPAELLPGDGRFGSGPSKVRPEAARALADVERHATSAPATASPA